MKIFLLMLHTFQNCGDVDTFFVNGEKVEGAVPFSEFEEVLLKYLPES